MEQLLVMATVALERVLAEAELPPELAEQVLEVVEMCREVM